MQIVIEISEEEYEYCKTWELMSPIAKAIVNGTPLPKGHGDLVTKEQMIDLVEFYQMNPQYFDFVNLIDEIRDEKPIIESDRSDT